MATLYWKNDSGTANKNWGSTSPYYWWTDAACTSRASSLPDSTTDVVFNTAANTGYGCIVAAIASFKTIDFTGYTGSLTVNAEFRAYGNVTFASGMSIVNTTYKRLYIYDNCTLTTNTLTLTNMGVEVGAVTGKTLSLGSDVVLGGFFQIAGSTNITFTTNNYNLTCLIFQGDGSGGTKTLNLGTSTITITWGSAGNTVYNMSGGSTWIVDGDEATVIIQSPSGGFAGGGKTYKKVSFTGGGIGWVYDTGNTFTDVYYTGTAAINAELRLSNCRITGELRVQGYSSAYRVLIDGQSCNITGATLSNCSYLDLRNCTFTYGANIDWTTINAGGEIPGGVGNCLGNTIAGGYTMTFTPKYATPIIWHADAGNWSDTTKWFLATNGGGGNRNVGGVNIHPLPQDDVTFDSSSIDTNGQTITIDVPRIGANIDFSGITRTSFRVNTASTHVTMYGSLTFVNTASSYMSCTVGTYYYIFEGRGSHTINTYGKSSYYLYINSTGGTYTVNSNLLLYALYHASGTLDLNDYNVSTGTAGSQVTLYQSVGSATKVLYMGNGTWTNIYAVSHAWYAGASVTGLTLYCEGSSIVISSVSGDFDGGGFTYNNVTLSNWATPTPSITGANTFANLTISGVTKSFKLPASATQTITGTLTVTGAVGAVYTIQSSVAGTQASISKASGNVQFTWCNLKDITGTGGASFQANNGTNIVNNCRGIVQAPAIKMMGGF